MKNLINPQVLADFRLKPTPLAKIVAFLDEQPDITAANLCKLIDLPAHRVYKWRSDAKRDESTESRTGASEFKVVPSFGKKARYSADDKFALLKQYDKLDPTKRAELLRTYGLYQSDISRWQEVADLAARESLGKRKPRSDRASDEVKAVEELKKEVSTHEKTISKLAALVVLQKKVSDILSGSGST